MINKSIIQKLLVQIMDSVKLGDQKYVIRLAYNILDREYFEGFLFAITTED